VNSTLQADRYRAHLTVALLCLCAGVVELTVFHNAVSHMNPDWDLALAVTWAGSATSVIILVASINGLRQNPSAIALAIFAVGLLAGLAGLIVTSSFQWLAGI
jgi:hypothetical protein